MVVGICRYAQFSPNLQAFALHHLSSMATFTSHCFSSIGKNSGCSFKTLIFVVLGLEISQNEEAAWSHLDFGIFVRQNFHQRD